jgi:hypothetical protein
VSDNPITQALDSLDSAGGLCARAGACGVLLADMYARLSALDHEAAVEEWRCPKCLHAEVPEKAFQTPGKTRSLHWRNDCIGTPYEHVLVVPFKAES